MAEYNRDFLKLYIRDVYTLHVAEKQRDAKYQETLHKLRAMQNEQEQSHPQKKRNIVNVMRIVFIGLALIAFAVLAFMLIGFVISDGPERIMGEKSVLLVLFSAVVFLILASLPFRSVVKQAGKKYLNVQQSQKLIALENEATAALEELQKIRDLLQKLYELNVIPSRYRTLEAAVYLNNVFTGNEDTDVAAALNAFVPEEVKEGLNEIVENHADISMNAVKEIEIRYEQFAETNV